MAGSSKLAMRSLLRGSGHLGKEGTKFQFDLTIESIQGLHTGPHTIKWTRGAKVAYTKPFQVDRRSKESLIVEQKISLLCTLYRSKTHSNGNSYDAKDSKISLVSLKDGKRNEKTIGKIHFNIAEYAGVPSSNASVKFRLNSKVRVELSIACTFVQVSKGTPSSVGSGLSGLTTSSGDPEADPENDDPAEEEFSDELEQLFSPTTPESQTLFQNARAIFSAKEDNYNPSSLDATKIATAFSKFSSSNTEEPMTSPADSGMRQKEETVVRSHGSSPVRSEREVTLVALERDNEGLHQELVRRRKELEKCRQLNKVNEEVIVELRQALSKHELESKDSQVIQRDASKTKSTEVNEEIKSIQARACQQAEDYEEQLNSLRVQVQSISRSKQRVEDEVFSVQVQQNALKNGPLGKGIGYKTGAEAELKKVKEECDLVDAKLNSELARRRGLEQKGDDLHNEVCRLRIKIQAHEEHSLQTKHTYEELSAMYGELREQHKLVQKELHLCRDGAVGIAAQKSIERSDSDRNRFSRRRNKTEQRFRTERSKDSAGELENLRMAFQDEQRKVRHIQTEKGDSDRQCLSLSADLELMKGKFEKSNAERSKLSKEYELMKANFLEASEKLESRDLMPNSDQKRTTPTDDLSLLSSSFNNHTEGMPNTELSLPTQQKIMKVVTVALEAKRTIQKMTTDLQEAYDREERYETEVRRMKQVIDDFTPSLQLAFDREIACREQLEEELQDARDHAEKSQTSLEVMLEKENIYREEITDLDGRVQDLEDTVETTRESSNLALVASRKELQLKQAELQTATLRIDSLERELSSKKEIAENLNGRTRELDLESQVLKRQASYELALVKETAKEMETSRRTDAVQMENYKTEIISLKAVADNLQIELQRSLEKAEEGVNNAQLEAMKNRRLREEAEERNFYLDGELKGQRVIVDSLQDKLKGSVEANHKVAQESSSETRQRLKALEEKEKLQQKLHTSASELTERDLKISHLSTRLETLQSTLEDTQRNSAKAIEKTTAKLKDREHLLDEALQKQEELGQKIEVQEHRLSSMQSELTLALKKTIQVSSDKDTDELEIKSLRAKLTATEEELERKELSIDAQKSNANGLGGKLVEAKTDVRKLQEVVASLRTALTDSQNKLAAMTAASAADSCRTSVELEEARSREQTLRDDISKKSEHIEDLTSKLTAVVGRSAADAALAQAELSEALSREESYKEELKQRKQMLDDLEDELMALKSSNAFTSANLEAEVTEALSREENYRFELKRLKGIIKELEQNLENERDTRQHMKDESQNNKQYGASSGSSASILQGVEAKTAAGMNANKAMVEVLGLDQSLSSSNIRTFDVFEKITDVRLLEMLVETKMQLALAEEEKLQLEHLIRRIRDGDKHVQKKLAQQAAKLELKLTKANHMTSSMQDDRSRELSRRESERSSSSALAREKGVLKGDQLQFFREQTCNKKARATSQRAAGRKNKNSSKVADPVDEWDIGDDSHEGAESTGDSQSQESSFSASSSNTE